VTAARIGSLAALGRAQAPAGGAAPLAVDGACVIDGAGVVAAGLLSAGRLAVGDAVVVSPIGIP
jgi:selenocysteine-specific translation elongation factor